jgi:hypothetical protein
MKDSLLDGIDESARFVEGTQGLSLTEVVNSVVCGVAEVHQDREIACKGRRVQLPLITDHGRRRVVVVS